MRARLVAALALWAVGLALLFYGDAEGAAPPGPLERKARAFWHSERDVRFRREGAADPVCALQGTVAYVAGGRPVIHLCRRYSTLAPPQRCHTVVHEFGHVLGYGHRRRGVMRPVVPAPAEVVPICRPRRP